MKKKYSYLAGLIAVFLLVSVSWGDDETTRQFTVSSVAGVYVPASSVSGLKTGFLAGVKADTNIAGIFDIGGEISFLTAKRGDSTTDGILCSLQALYPFHVKKSLVPFVTAGVGGIFFDVGKSSPALSVGVGLKYFLTDRLALRGDLIDLASVRNGDNGIEMTVGVSYLFGGNKKNIEVIPLKFPESSGGTENKSGE
jgi:OOP family OmpA-OmpF porin